MVKDKVRRILKNYLNGKLRCTEFAITNSCIAKCSFCDIWKQSPKVFVDREKALCAIDRLAEFGVSHLTLTGGEPLMHPNIIEFVERATRHSMNNAVLVAAPQLLTRNDMIPRLEAAGCDLVSVSFDSGDPVTMAESRQIKNIMGEMETAMRQIQTTGLKTMASVLIWNDNYDRLDEVCARAVGMGFDVISLNYPTFSKSVVYALGGEGVSLSRENVIFALESAIALKKSKKYPIINSAISMQNIIDYLKDPASAKYPCFGGARVLFVDWFFDVRPCMQLPQVLGNILTMDESALMIPACNQCNMSWYRDFSTFFHGARTIPVLIEALSDSGRLL
ncbi:MAG: radical SAM protein [Clostridiales bacterium]|jgi:MoaA/NifB/PqqE/SkfB family radical SAM enzyme|nr:radical SAM protein [Clostridiales bacterium]